MEAVTRSTPQDILPAAPRPSGVLEGVGRFWIGGGGAHGFRHRRAHCVHRSAAVRHLRQDHARRFLGTAALLQLWMPCAWSLATSVVLSKCALVRPYPRHFAGTVASWPVIITSSSCCCARSPWRVSLCSLLLSASVSCSCNWGARYPTSFTCGRGHGLRLRGHAFLR